MTAARHRGIPAHILHTAQVGVRGLDEGLRKSLCLEEECADDSLAHSGRLFALVHTVNICTQEERKLKALPFPRVWEVGP